MSIHALIGQAEKIPVNTPVPAVTMGPVVLKHPGRAVDLSIKISAPATGSNLPIILMSHGQGRSNNLNSLRGYAPICDFWAAHGFVVVQPTHLSSRSLNIDQSLPGAPMFTNSRAEDLKYILDHLDEVEKSVSIIAGRLDKSRIAVAGHSAGGRTASSLLGMKSTDPDGTVFSIGDPRVSAGLVIASPGAGGDSLSDFVRENMPHFRHPDFSTMTTPALVIVGDEDNNPRLTVRGAAWHTDPYHLSPSPKSMLTLFGAKHGLGGIAGYDAGETDDESVEKVAVLQRMTLAYLRSTLYPGDASWAEACAALAGLDSIGKTESK